MTKAQTQEDEFEGVEPDMRGHHGESEDLAAFVHQVSNDKEPSPLGAAVLLALGMAQMVQQSYEEHGDDVGDDGESVPMPAVGGMVTEATRKVDLSRFTPNGRGESRVDPISENGKYKASAMDFGVGFYTVSPMERRERLLELLQHAKPLAFFTGSEAWLTLQNAKTGETLPKKEVFTFTGEAYNMDGTEIEAFMLTYELKDRRIVDAFKPEHFNIFRYGNKDKVDGALAGMLAHID